METILKATILDLSRSCNIYIKKAKFVSAMDCCIQKCNIILWFRSFYFIFFYLTHYLLEYTDSLFSFLVYQIKERPESFDSSCMLHFIYALYPKSLYFVLSYGITLFMESL